jgi:hypothetical protein
MRSAPRPGSPYSRCAPSHSTPAPGKAVIDEWAEGFNAIHINACLTRLPLVVKSPADAACAQGAADLLCAMQLALNAAEAAVPGREAPVVRAVANQMWALGCLGTATAAAARLLDDSLRALGRALAGANVNQLAAALGALSVLWQEVRRAAAAAARVGGPGGDCVAAQTGAWSALSSKPRPAPTFSPRPPTPPKGLLRAAICGDVPACAHPPRRWRVCVPPRRDAPGRRRRARRGGGGLFGAGRVESAARVRGGGAAAAAGRGGAGAGAGAGAGVGD